MKFAYRKVLKDTGLIKPLIDGYLIGGKIPFFVNLEDAKELLTNIRKFTGHGLADNDTLNDIFLSLLARTKNDHNIHWRHAGPKDKILWVGLGKVGLSRLDGITKMGGAYLREGQISSALENRDNPNGIEEIIR